MLSGWLQEFYFKVSTYSYPDHWSFEKTKKYIKRLKTAWGMKPFQQYLRICLKYVTTSIQLKENMLMLD